MDIITYSHARKNLRSVLNSIIDSKPVIIKSKESTAVVIDYNQYLNLVDKINTQEQK